MSAAERRAEYSIEEGREDIIIAGTVILLMIMKGLGFGEVIVSEYGDENSNRRRNRFGWQQYY